MVELSARLAERIAEDDGWNNALHELADVLHGTAICIHRYNRLHRVGEAVQVLRGLTREDADEYRQHHAPHNVWMERLETAPLSGQVLVSHHVCPESELVRHRFYDEFLKPRGLFAMLAVVLEANGDGFETVNILRGPDPGRFTDDEHTLVRRLVPHLLSLQRISRLLGEERARRELMCEVLDRISTAVIALDANLRVIECNRAAVGLLAAGDGVELAGGRLELSDRQARDRLSSAVRSLTGAVVGIGAATGATSFAIGRPSSRRPLAATIVPARASCAAVAARGACCLLFVEDLEQTSSPAADHLIELWQLTRAEARIACLLCAGHSPREIADACEVSFNTVRSHIQRILLKTDTVRQSDLVRLLTRMGLAAKVTQCEGEL